MNALAPKPKRLGNFTNAVRRREIVENDRLLERRQGLEARLALHFDQVERGARQRGEVVEREAGGFDDLTAPRWARWVENVMREEALELTAGRELTPEQTKAMNDVLRKVTRALAREQRVTRELARTYVVWVVEALIGL